MNNPHLYQTLSLPRFTHLPVALRTTNIGDDIQVECARRLWGLDGIATVDRDNFREWGSDSVIPFFGWYGYDSFSHPPEGQVVLMSVHFSLEARKRILASKTFLPWFKACARQQEFPVYARDTSTRDWIRSLGIESEFGGCITSTLPVYEGPRAGVFSVDAPSNADPGAEVFSNAIGKLPSLGAASRGEIAREILEKIRKAEMVHTNRLHIALPARASGTPFRFYDHRIFERHRLSGHGLIEGV